MRGSHAPVPSPEAVAALSARLGAGVVDDLDTRQAWTLGGVVPSLVARPADAVELAASVAAAAETGAVLVPFGLGAHRALGHPPARYDLALVTERLARIRDYTPADMTVTVEAGTTLSALTALLARERQWLPIEPAVPAVTTVGGMLAADLAGPLAGSQGRVRDFVIGIVAVTATGVSTRAGGRVVKNVAGYDLMKLFIGSLGTLAVVTEVTFKVRPLPEAQRCVVFATRRMATALEVGAAIGATGSEVLAVTVVADLGGSDRDVMVVVRLGGITADVEVARVRMRALAERHGCAIVCDADGVEPGAIAHLERVRDFVVRGAGDLVVRFAVLPWRLSGLVADLETAESAVWGACHVDPLRGVVTLAVTTDTAEPVLMALARTADVHGARLVIERWPPELASTIEVWRPLPPALPLMRRMKVALDPQGTFGPGRFVGRL